MQSHLTPIVGVALCVTVAAINPRLWIVAPFGNATKAADLAWLREATMNMDQIRAALAKGDRKA